MICISIVACVFCSNLLTSMIYTSGGGGSEQRSCWSLDL